MSSVSSGTVGSDAGVSKTKLSVWGDVAVESFMYKCVDAVEMDERVVKQVGEFVNTCLSHHVLWVGGMPFVSCTNHCTANACGLDLVNEE
jgi:hypothetical protein